MPPIELHQAGQEPAPDPDCLTRLQVERPVAAPPTHRRRWGDAVTRLRQLSGFPTDPSAWACDMRRTGRYAAPIGRG